jgi:transcription elongation factor Elf1
MTDSTAWQWQWFKCPNCSSEQYLLAIDANTKKVIGTSCKNCGYSTGVASSRPLDPRFADTKKEPNE